MKKLLLITATVFFIQICNAQTVTDIDGNVYQTVIIGTQKWMVENLKTTNYKDGSAIPNVTDSSSWSALTTPAYCWNNNDAANNKATYGALYNWHTVNTGKLAPTGWHVPTDAEWTTLENYLIANGYNYDGTTSGNKIAKSLASATGWVSSSTTGAVGNTDYASKRNLTSFTALPSGFRDNTGPFIPIGTDCNWWSSTESKANHAFFRDLNNAIRNMERLGGNMSCGFSVRCLNDTLFKTTGLNNIQNKIKISTHPNPTSSMVTLSFSAALIKETLVEIYNLQGTMVFSKTFQNTPSATIDLTGKAAGIYVVKVIADGVSYEEKIVKE